MLIATELPADSTNDRRDCLSDAVNSTSDPPARGAPASTLAAEIADMIRRHRRGDATAMDELVRRVTPWLYRIAMNHRLNHHSAEDVVQDTLLVLVRNLHAVRDPQAGLAWLSVVAQRQSGRVVRGEQRVQLSTEVVATIVADDADDPERRAVQALTRAAVDQAIAELPDRHARFLRLAFLADERDYATISGTLDMPVGSIGPTRQRALRKMRRLLRARGEDLG
jgi:RNA polymerase sigma factor (sigma-70 family)